LRTPGTGNRSMDYLFFPAVEMFHLDTVLGNLRNRPAMANHKPAGVYCNAILSLDLLRS